MKTIKLYGQELEVPADTFAVVLNELGNDRQLISCANLELMPIAWSYLSGSWVSVSGDLLSCTATRDQYFAIRQAMAKKKEWIDRTVITNFEVLG